MNTDGSKILEVSRVSKQLGEVQVLRDVSISIGPGEFVGLIGPNGAGKTTLINCITTQLIPDAGRIAIFGHDITSSPVEAKKHLGYAIEPHVLPDQLTGRQFATLYASARSVSNYESQLEELSTLLDLSPRLDRVISTYSAGMRQKLCVIAALLGDPPLIVLDESISGLDPLSSYRLKNYLSNTTRSKKQAIFLASHLVDSVEKYCSRILVIHEGAIVTQWLRQELEDLKRRHQSDLEELFLAAVGMKRIPGLTGE